MEKKKILRNIKKYSFLSPENMLKKGFEDISNPEKTSNGYFKFQNNGTILYNPDYNPNFPEPKGKVIIYVNFSYTPKYPYISIRQDGDTRNSYSGIVSTQSFLDKLLKSVR